jgi:pyruvate formate lyase activating enzyme
MAKSDDLSRTLASHTVRGALYERSEQNSLRCMACAHRCVIAEGKAGACGVRLNQAGVLFVPFGYVARRYVRSVETNTVFHVKPGASALTFGMYGCDLRCPYCHNHEISQALRDGSSGEAPRSIDAEGLVEQAVTADCEVICAAYNEPMISAEWAKAVFTAAKRRGLTTAIISDGNATPEALEFMRPVTDVYRVDLKAYSRQQYHLLGGRLEPVLEAIRLANALGYWVEVVTLVVPGFNDSAEGLKSLMHTLIEIDPKIPWHINAFMPRYQMRDRPTPDGKFLMLLAGIAYARGMKFVYVGNHPSVLELSHTRCPECTSVLLRRRDYALQSNDLVAGACPACATPIPGLW